MHIHTHTFTHIHTQVPPAAGQYTLEVPLWRPVELATSRTSFLANPFGYIGQSLTALVRRSNGVFLGVCQNTATQCNTLQHTATYCNTLQHTATHCHSAGAVG